MKMYIGFSRPIKNKWLSSIIMETEKRNYSHVFIKLLDQETGQWMIYQASQGFVNYQSFDKFLEKNVVQEEYELVLTNETYKNIKSYCNTLLGRRYGYLQIVNITIQKILKTKNVKYFMDYDKTFICSELGYNVIRLTYPVVLVDQDNVTPSDLNKHISSIGLKRIK